MKSQPESPDIFEIRSDITGTGLCSIERNRHPGPDGEQDKPLEDYLIKDDTNGIFIVCDGVTRTRKDGKYPVPSPAARAAKSFADTVHCALLNLLSLPPDERLVAAVKKGNAAVDELNNFLVPEVDYLENDFAGAVGIVAFLEGGHFYYAHIGDCSCLMIRDGTISRLTEPQTAKLEYQRKELGDDNDAIQIIRRSIRNVPGHPAAYGVYTGEDSALQFVEYNKVALTGRETIILASDGLDHVMHKNPGLATELLPGHLIRYAEEEEQLLGIRSDDKSIIVLQTFRNF